MDAGEAVRGTIRKITPGQSEIEIAARMRAELAAMNVNSVVTLVAADERIAKYRHPDSDRKPMAERHFCW
jgi:antitoxin VapB